MTNKLIFEPNDWHSCKTTNWESCKNGVNCYSYALNNSKYYWAVPGHGYAHTEGKIYFDHFDLRFQDDSLENFRKKIIDGAVSDGLIPITQPVEKDGYYLSALYFPTHIHDFHWFRKDSDGFWSHKNGYKEPSRLDDEGIPIHDIQKANHKNYPLFGGLFHVPNEGIYIDECFMRQ
jgi:hypothetical protein